MSRHALIGSAGVYYVAHKVNLLGFHCAPTLGNAPNVDLLASSVDGSKNLSIQVKSTENALRTRGRGKDKTPFEYQWSIGRSSFSLNSDSLLFALVDFRGDCFDDGNAVPDVYVVPSRVINEYYASKIRDDFEGDQSRWIWPRFHVPVESLKEFKNSWNLIESALSART